MSTSTSTRTITATHTATYLTDAIFGSLGTLLAHLGLGSTALTTTWATKYAPAIATWIRETSLDAVVLECTTPAGTKHRFDFEIDYASGDGVFRNRSQLLAGYYDKLDQLPPNTTWRIVCTYRFSHTPQDGWSTTALAAGSGTTLSLGTLARAPHANVGLKTYGGA